MRYCGWNRAGEFVIGEIDFLQVDEASQRGRQRSGQVIGRKIQILEARQLPEGVRNLSGNITVKESQLLDILELGYIGRDSPFVQRGMAYPQTFKPFYGEKRFRKLPGNRIHPKVNVLELLELPNLFRHRIGVRGFVAFIDEMECFQLGEVRDFFRNLTFEIIISYPYTAHVLAVRCHFDPRP